MEQIIFFLLPGLTEKETKIILPLLLSSLVLFGLGLLFSYYALIPAALNFFLNYSDEVIEPLWSFDQYFEFILVLFYGTGLAFQIPIVQILLGLLNIVSATQMLNAWRYSNINVNNNWSRFNTIYRSIYADIASQWQYCYCIF